MPAVSPSTLLLNHGQIARLAGLEDYFAVVEEAFRAQGAGLPFAEAALQLSADTGEFHVKAGGHGGARPYYTFKINAGFFQNSSRHGLPNVAGTIVLCDGGTGAVLAVMGSGEITRQRTAAAAAVAASRLANPESSTLAVAGCGALGRAIVPALARVLPLTAVLAYDPDPAQQQSFCHMVSAQLKMEARAVTVDAMLQDCDVCVTCTPSRRPLICAAAVRTGTFIAAMGADSADKQELEAELVACATVVTDRRERCSSVGELHHALAAGLIPTDRGCVELGEILAGRQPGRRSPGETIIFDSTGTALQDVAAAALIYERACVAGVGEHINFLA